MKIDQLINKITIATIVAVLFVIIFALPGCKVASPVIGTNVSKEVIYKDRLIKDSIYIRDSVFVTKKNDTVYITKYRKEFNGSKRLDAAFISKTDTIIKPVVNPLNTGLKMQNTKLIIAVVVLSLILVVVVYLKIKEYLCEKLILRRKL